jgi:HPt (histidine-containing phosphotransfer) domain-containing protein
MENNPDQLFDLKDLKATAAGDEDFFNEMVSLFIKQNDGAIGDITLLMTRRDDARLNFILHKMKSSVVVMGVTAMTDLILKVESLDLKALDDLAFAELCDTVIQLMQRVNDQMKSL